VIVVLANLEHSHSKSELTYTSLYRYEMAL